MGLGDEILVSGLIELQKSKGLKCVVVENNKGTLNPIKWNNDMHQIFKNNPFIENPTNIDNNKEYNYINDHSGCRGYINYEKSILHRKKKVRFLKLNSTYKANKGKIYFDSFEKKIIENYKHKYGCYILLNTAIKKSLTSNKELPIKKWSQLNNMLLKRGLKTAIMINNDFSDEDSAITELKGVIKINTKTIRKMLCAIAASKMVVTTEGGVHHAAAALDKKCLVIYGGRIDPSILGYESQINIIDDRPIFNGDSNIRFPCGMFSDCIHCKTIMNNVPTELMYEQIIKNL